MAAVVETCERGVSELLTTHYFKTSYEKLKEVYDVLINSENEWIGIITEGMSEDELLFYIEELS